MFHLARKALPGKNSVSTYVLLTSITFQNYPLPRSIDERNRRNNVKYVQDSINKGTDIEEKVQMLQEMALQTTILEA